MFVIGGLSGVTHAIVPSDYQQTDTYYIVAHFHYVLFGGAIFGFFVGLLLLVAEGVRTAAERDARQGRSSGSCSIGFNLAFGPMHVLGLQGMIRREYTYPESLGLTFWNQVSTLGAFLIALSVLLFIVERRPHAAASHGRGGRGPVGRAHARVDDRRPAARVQLRRDPRRALARRVLAPQVRRGRTQRPARAGPGGCRRTTHDDTHAAGPRIDPPAEPVVLAARGRASACRSWPTGCIYSVVADRPSARSSCWSASTAGRSSPRWRRSRRGGPRDRLRDDGAADAAHDEHETTTGPAATRSSRCGSSSPRSACSSAR